MLSITDGLSRPGNPLYGLITQAKYLDATDKRLATYLGPPTSYHCQLATVSFDTVVLCVDSPVWYSKLRFLAPDIVKFFRNECGLKTVSKVSIRMDPSLFQHTASLPVRQEPSDNKHLRISPNVARLLHNVAEATKDSALREAWFCLARNSTEP